MRYFRSYFGSRFIKYHINFISISYKYHARDVLCKYIFLCSWKFSKLVWIAMLEFLLHNFSAGIRIIMCFFLWFWVRVFPRILEFIIIIFIISIVFYRISTSSISSIVCMLLGSFIFDKWLNLMLKFRAEQKCVKSVKTFRECVY